MYQHIF